MLEQVQLPILLAVDPPAISVRLDPWESQLVGRVGQQSGLSRSEIIRRCIRLVQYELHLHGGSPDFLVNPERLAFPADGRRHGGRKPRGRKIAELEKIIATTLRALEAQRRELNALKAREERAA